MKKSWKSSTMPSDFKPLRKVLGRKRHVSRSTLNSANPAVVSEAKVVETITVVVQAKGVSGLFELFPSLIIYTVSRYCHTEGVH